MGLVTGGTFAERGRLTSVFDECGVLVEDCQLSVSNFIRPTEERGEGGEGGSWVPSLWCPPAMIVLGCWWDGFGVRLG